MAVQKHKQPDYWAGLHLELKSAEFAPRIMDPQLLFINNVAGHISSKVWSEIDTCVIFWIRSSINKQVKNYSMDIYSMMLSLWPLSWEEYEGKSPVHISTNSKYASK